MEQLIIGSLALSILHAVIPSHWLPVVAIGRKENWAIGKVLRVTALATLVLTGLISFFIH